MNKNNLGLTLIIGTWLTLVGMIFRIDDVVENWELFVYFGIVVLNGTGWYLFSDFRR